ncbi:MAG TPA: hypothetical protein VFZ08_07505 [Terriglobia bacterium]|nr:hypothetical protein [Terriglobia bacterium]
MGGSRIPGPVCVENQVCEADDAAAGQCSSSLAIPPPLQPAESSPAALSCSISSQYASSEAAQQQAQRPASPPANQGGASLTSGSVPAITVGFGMASIARIPVPGSKGLFIELSPRGWIPKSGSTSRVFIQDIAGKRVLRLDYGYNKTTSTIDYHWNQKGTFAEFGISDHAPAGSTGEALFKSARYFKYAGRALLVVGIAMDVYSIVVAKKRWRQVAKVAAGWAGAWAGCELLGGGGAEGGTAVEPGGGTVIGGLGGCIVGGIAGGFGARWAAGKTYDWVEETYFEPIPEAPAAGK